MTAGRGFRRAVINLSPGHSNITARRGPRPAVWLWLRRATPYRGLLAGLLWFSSLVGRAEVPPLFNVQGRLLIGTAAVDGPAEFKFALVNANGTQTYWRNSADANADGQPDQAVALTLSRGLYSVALGDSALANMSALPTDLFVNREVYLRVWVNHGASGFQSLTPDQRITPAGYAMISATVTDGAITTAKLAPGVLDGANITGVLSAARIPQLDAEKIGSGTLLSARLPTNVAYKDLDVVTSSNVLAARLIATNGLLVTKIENDVLSSSNVVAARLIATNATLVAKIDALSATVQSLTTQLAALQGNTTQVAPVLVSSANPDAALIGQGYAAFSTLPAPAWTAGTSTDVPSARTAHSTVWTGDAMVVWGGTVAAGLHSASGGIYDPAANQWNAISSINAPTARSGHSAVWTGTEMLVWGGLTSPLTYLNQGARWQRSPQTWTALATANAPSGRDGHVAVWTGSKMLIWGGRNSAGLLSDGALFDPALNQWTALTLPGAPSARFRATAVWTGTRALVWGGEGPSGTLNDGAQLVFDAAGAPLEWRSITATGAPSIRTRHTAVWTSDRMIVWGGSNGSAALNTGAKYDPIGNTWVALESSGAPSARSEHNALWTGQEILVLGGLNEAGELAGGAAYNPASGQWRALSSAGNPQPRSGSGAVWSGTELLVFGGSAQGNSLAALERLNPQPTWHFYRKQ